MEAGEWRVVWVPDPGGWGPISEDALGVNDLPQAVRRLGLVSGDPVFLTPDFIVDLDLLDFVQSNVFRWLERESKRNYATDIRLLLDFLWSREVPWRKASERDLADYRAWRCRAPENPRRISGAKWNREAAAFTKLYRWARVSPLPVDVSRREYRAAHAVSSRVSWLTPRTWGLWSNIGLRGHTRTGLPAVDWASRTEMRNTSFVQLLLSSGLRRQEAGSLLTFEVPTQRLRFGRYLHGKVASAVTRSKRDRTFYAGVDAVGQIEAYAQSERAWAVSRAQDQGRYDRLPQLRRVTDVSRGLNPVVRWQERDGTEGRQRLGALGWRERRWLFVDGPDGLEPAWLWLTEHGTPMLPEQWNGVFRQANLRCEQVLLNPAEREVGRRLRTAEARGKTPYATPHACRHSFALYMLIVLNQLMEVRFGLTAADRRDFAQRFGDPWFLVKTLLGHADVETTKQHYLSPVSHLQLESILAASEDSADDGDTTAGQIEDLDEVFARLARETSGIQDVDTLVDTLPQQDRR
jgi:site-specific recombinase XerD